MIFGLLVIVATPAIVSRQCDRVHREWVVDSSGHVAFTRVILFDAQDRRQATYTAPGVPEESHGPWLEPSRVTWSNGIVRYEIRSERMSGAVVDARGNVIDDGGPFGWFLSMAQPGIGGDAGRTRIFPALASVPASDQQLRDHVELIEVNHVYDDEGKLVFTQLIFREWHDGEYECEAWRITRDTVQEPRRTASGYVVRWTEAGKQREVRARSVLETWTQHDREVAERERYPVNKRRGLTGERL